MWRLFLLKVNHKGCGCSPRLSTLPTVFIFLQYDHWYLFSSFLWLLWTLVIQELFEKEESIEILFKHPISQWMEKTLNGQPQVLFFNGNSKILAYSYDNTIAVKLSKVLYCAPYKFISGRLWINILKYVMNLKLFPSVLQLSLTVLSSRTFEISCQRHTVHVLVLTWFDLGKISFEASKALSTFTTIHHYNLCVTVYKYYQVLPYKLSWRHCQTVPVALFDVNLESILLIFSSSCDIFLSSCIFCGLSFSCQSHTDLHYGYKVYSHQAVIFLCMYCIPLRTTHT